MTHMGTEYTVAIRESCHSEYSTSLRPILVLNRPLLHLDATDRKGRRTAIPRNAFDRLPLVENAYRAIGHIYCFIRRPAHRDTSDPLRLDLSTRRAEPGRVHGFGWGVLRVHKPG
jgi:hypothetical protein